MTAKPIVTEIPATLTMFEKADLRDMSRKRRTAGYARVSTDSEEQEGSFTAQVDYYTKKIAENPDWEFCGVYTDEGISALNTKKRDGFKQMIADALAGKLELIVTKSVSRFARNTLDSLNYIRKLKDAGVEIWFEKENIFTFSSSGELMITIMSALAQEESRSLSLNVTWGQRKRFADGQVSLPYSRFLGYEKGADGRPKIVEREAKIVRRIYNDYLQGQTIRQIAASLTAQGIPTPGGKAEWSVSTIRSILSSEKYRGEATLQKTFTLDYLSKKMVKNEGQVPMFHVENSHDAIVSPELHQLVQEELARNAQLGHGRRNISPFSGRVVCPCGEFFGRKTQHSQDCYKKIVWQCNGRYRDRAAPKCKSPGITEEALQQAFVQAFNAVLGDRECYISNMEPAIALLTDCADLDGEEQILLERQAGIYAQMEALVAEIACPGADRAACEAQYSELKGRHDDVKARLEKLAAERLHRMAKREKMRRFLETVRQREGLLVEFEEPLFRAVIEKISVHAIDHLIFTFRDGREIPIDASKF
ncbi:MAG: recombinase family protein [Oscillospiraceae bacterium]|jgi:DNA invertase Pin-like site-specific DNA recombinase|nr:recombinase family protein [Oscillospiraceae bacterium]